MALAAFTPTCGKNIPGNAPELYLIEANKITSVTETANEISAVTMAGTAKFHKVKADFDSVQFTSEGTFKTTGGETQNLIFRVSKGDTAAENFVISLKDAAPCGMVAIYVDGNRQAKAFGISAATKEGKTRPINQVAVSYDSGTLITDEDTQAYTITLTRLGYYGPIPFNGTANATITGGSAEFITW